MTSLLPRTKRRLNRMVSPANGGKFKKFPKLFLSCFLFKLMYFFANVLWVTCRFKKKTKKREKVKSTLNGNCRCGLIRFDVCSFDWIKNESRDTLLGGNFVKDSHPSTVASLAHSSSNTKNRPLQKWRGGGNFPLTKHNVTTFIYSFIQEVNNSKIKRQLLKR